MDKFYISKFSETNGDYDVHKADCLFLPSEKHRFFLGSFDKCSEAIKKGKEIFDKPNGCYFCILNCHIS